MLASDPIATNERLNGAISSNNDDGITPELLETLIEGPGHFQKLPSLFDRSNIPPRRQDSPFRRFPSSHHQTIQAANDEREEKLKEPDGIYSRSIDFLSSVEDWYQRFLYLALHWKFHPPAL